MLDGRNTIAAQRHARARIDNSQSIREMCLMKADDGRLIESGNLCPRLTSEWNHLVNADETNGRRRGEQ